ncbi:MAG: glucose 1-dehydrogenase [Chloroflexi bacterium]|nr:glucose 1-dehydrogenase [Chloroflexota bacterium]
MRLADKIAIVTGGSRGIGQAIAHGMAEEGARVVVFHSSAPGTFIGSTGRPTAAAVGEPLEVHGDVSSRADVERLVQTTLAAYGGIDVLVNVAGVAVFGEFLEMTEAEWERQLAVNAKGVFLASQAVARVMARQGGGRIVNVTSISGERADPALVAYCASKAAANMLTKAMAAALGKYNITVNAVMPGTTVTDMNRDRLADERIAGPLRAMTPLGRLGAPADIVGAVLYLASPEAAWTSGALIPVDGGFLT